MRGTRITIPDLQLLTDHWPSAIHRDIEELEHEFNGILQHSAFSSLDHGRLQKMARFEIPHFGACWFSFAVTFEALLVATLFSTWLFVWDDETDSHEFSTLIDDFEKSCAFRKETLDYLKKSLRLHDDGISTSSISHSPIITSFEPIADVLIKQCTESERSKFMRELQFFIEMTEEEQQIQRRHYLPSVEEYMRRRMGSSAVRTCLALHEYVLGSRLPEDVMNSEYMHTIWHETNVIISVENDILSIKKEVDQSQVDTLIPLLSLELGSVQLAIEHATEMVRRSVQRLEAAEKLLLEKYSSHTKLQADLRKFISTCKSACNGNLNWSMTSGRYKLGCSSLKGGLSIVL
ncbi:isoprenoid synthase domain-containing protein [Stachybotrys elegans]|uniref:Terpene synthase n=1 Tax=Stachybotrys elegans TaxID=80388 RepID=A0A8K0WKC9_9HYPO|nr:isoprenoid synthase domain-containing protein [Stachybotrys elegans]